MAKLSEEAQDFIVRELACFTKPALVVREVKAQFGVTVTSQQVLFYHPERGSKAKRLGKKHVALFEKTRAAFLEEKVTVGIAHKMYRLRL